ncbi:MAG: TadE/TadG family type IV pilus assembly protein [Marmoricola sp.]
MDGKLGDKRPGRLRSERGAAAVEFALVMLPVVVLLFGLIQYGMYFWAMQGGSDIARSAARLSSVGKPTSCSDFQAAVGSDIKSLSGTTVAIQRSYDKQSASAVQVGDTVRVTVKFRSVNLHFPFIPLVQDGMVTSTAESRVDFVPSQPEACS